MLNIFYILACLAGGAYCGHLIAKLMRKRHAAKDAEMNRLHALLMEALEKQEGI